MIYGYVRVSTKKQEKGYSMEEQEARILARYSDAVIIRETKQGNSHRPEFEKLVGMLQPGDMIVVVDHTRFSRDTADGLKIAEKLMDKGVLIHFLSFGLLENTPVGKFVLTLLLAQAEMEVSMIQHRTQPARARARKKPGYREGRPKKYTKKQITHAMELLETRSYSDVENLTGISKSTLIRARKKYIEQIEKAL